MRWHRVFNLILSLPFTVPIQKLGCIDKTYILWLTLERRHLNRVCFVLLQIQVHDAFSEREITSKQNRHQVN